MNGKDLLKGFTYVDEGLINEGENIIIKKTKKRAILSVAASFVIVITAFSLWTNYKRNIPPIEKYTLSYNNANRIVEQNMYIKGHFWQDLSSIQKEKILPTISSKYEVEGCVNYSYWEGKVSIFNINTTLKIQDKNNVEITIAPKEVQKCYVFDGEPVISDINGVKVEAGIFKDNNYIYYADFIIDDIAYYVEFVGEEKDKDLFKSIVVDIILDGKTDLSILNNPTVPKLRNDNLNEKEVYEESDFGDYLIKVPNTYKFNSARRFINQESDYLFASWSMGYNDIDIKISKLREEDKNRIISIEDVNLYDMTLYPSPWSETMPSDKREIIENPIFRSEDLSLYVIKKRGYSNNMSMRFSVLYNDVLVEVMTEGIDYEYLYNQLKNIYIK